MDLFPAFERRRFQSSGAGINYIRAGTGDPVLLLDGYPQTHACWHRIAPELAQQYTVVCADLRGYGDSSKPRGLPDHSNYSKRAMAQDIVELMTSLGLDRFHLVGHDRGARVAHRLAADHPQSAHTLAVLDISPTLEMFERTDIDLLQKRTRHQHLSCESGRLPGFGPRHLGTRPVQAITHHRSPQLGAGHFEFVKLKARIARSQMDGTGPNHKNACVIGLAIPGGHEAYPACPSNPSQARAELGGQPAYADAISHKEKEHL